MYSKILVPTDGSTLMDEVIERAIDLADTYDATIHGLYVVNTSATSTLDPDTRETVDRSLASRGEQATETITAAAEEAGVECETRIERGIPDEEIVEYAEGEGIDMIVMGTHGRTGLSHFLLGSVAEKVLRQATVPVFLVRTTDHGSEN